MANNFQQWNPSSNNQESDAAYTADTLRANGIPSGVGGSGVLAPSVTHNKLYYQLSTFVAAFAAMMAAKGFNMLDTVLVNLQTVLAGVLTTADGVPQETATVDRQNQPGPGSGVVQLFVPGTAGLYLIAWSLTVMATGNAVNMNLSFSWTDEDNTGVGDTSPLLGNLPCNVANGNAQGSLMIAVPAGGGITGGVNWSVGFTGVQGSGLRYGLHIKAIKL